tara:strand:+ start:4316 stop:5104 length:789 start_codon:yes stop_codon:yes gene_type:complete
METYKGKTILITGASSGIGEAFAKRLDQLGANLILTARSKDKLLELASSMKNAIVIDGDLSDINFPENLYNEIKSRNLSVDILINNAGFGFSGYFLDSDIDNYQDMLNVNIYSLTKLTHLFLKDMVDCHKGGIINISSLASYQPVPYFAVYAASKSYVTSFTIALYEEYRKKGINILGVCPGYTKTNFNKRAHVKTQNIPGYIMSSEAVVEQSLKAFKKKKYILINGKINNFAKFITTIMPQRWALKIAKNIIKKGMNDQRW